MDISRGAYQNMSFDQTQRVDTIIWAKSEDPNVLLLSALFCCLIAICTADHRLPTCFRVASQAPGQSHWWKHNLLVPNHKAINSIYFPVIMPPNRKNDIHAISIISVQGDFWLTHLTSFGLDSCLIWLSNCLTVPSRLLMCLTNTF